MANKMATMAGCCCVTPCAAGFSFAETTPANKFNFTDTSTGADSWLWDFGDGATSTAQNPSHQYADGQSYTVRLTITVDGVECYIEKEVGGTVECGECDPDPLPRAVAVTVSSSGGSCSVLCPNGTFVLDDSVFGPCFWEYNTVILAACICSDFVTRNASRSISAAFFKSGGVRYWEVKLTTIISTPDGVTCPQFTTHVYRKSLGSDASPSTNCRGTHTLDKISGSSSAGCSSPSTITLEV